ncbi:hypothetical protein ABMB44_12890 [Levilactobacillus brevis]
MSKQAILANYPDAARWAFGDGPALADELLGLVLSGDFYDINLSYLLLAQRLINDEKSVRNVSPGY